MSPFPIIPVNDRRREPENFKQDITGLIPILVNPLTVLQDYLNLGNDKSKLKDIWLKSEAQEDGTIKVTSSISDRDLWELKGRGLIDGDGRIVSFTDKGKKILKESILNDENSSLSKKASFVKKASKKLVSKNSYDFGNEVLVRISDKEKFGTRYVTIVKSAFKDSKTSPKEIDEYTFSPRFDNGVPKQLKNFSEEELVQILHISKNIISNKDKIIKNLVAEGSLTNSVPIHRIKAFMAEVMEELNLR